MILANLYPLKTVILGSLFALGLVLLMPSTSNASASHELFKGPNGISVSGGHVWVTNVATLNKGGDWITELKASNGSLVRIINASADEFSNVGEIAVSGGHVWVTNSGTPSISDFGTPSTVDSVIELNASNGSLVRVISASADEFVTPNGIAVSGRHVWVANWGGTSVTELNASNGSLERVISASADEFVTPNGITVSGGHVWVTNSGGTSITELNASNGSLVRVINPQGNGNFDNAGGITVSGGHVWVTNQKDDAVTELNASNGSLVRVIKASADEFSEPVGIAVSGGHVWVTNIGTLNKEGDLKGDSVTELNASNGSFVRAIK
jgi:streptogramin lyase